MVGLRDVVGACYGSVLRFTPRSGVVHAFEVHEKGEDSDLAGVLDARQLLFVSLNTPAFLT